MVFPDLTTKFYTSNVIDWLQILGSWHTKPTDRSRESFCRFAPEITPTRSDVIRTAVLARSFSHFQYDVLLKLHGVLDAVHVSFARI